MTATLDRLSDGRLLVNVVTGGDPSSWKATASSCPTTALRTVREFLHVCADIACSQRGEVMTSKASTSSEGRQAAVSAGAAAASAAVLRRLVGRRHDLAAEQVDHYLTWGEPPAEVAKKIGRRARARRESGRKVQFGIRLHVIVRETNDEAWAAADELISYLDDDTIARKRSSRAWTPKASAACAPCMAGAAPSWRSAPTCGPASGWCVAVRARRWWAMPRRWRRA